MLHSPLASESWVREQSMWKRLAIIALFAVSTAFVMGCPGNDGGEAPSDGGTDETTTTDDNGNSSGGAFNEGVGSGRSEDGSDEDK